MKLLFNLSSKRIQEAVKKAIILKGKMSIDVDLESLSASDREILSENIEYKYNEDAFVVNLLSSDHSDYRSNSNLVSSETISGIIDDMKKIEEARAAYIEKEKKNKEISAEIDAIFSGIQDDLFKIERIDSTCLYFKVKEGTYSRELRLSNSTDKNRIDTMLNFVKSEQILVKLNEVKAEYQASIKHDEEKAAAEAVKKVAIEAGCTELLSWAKENGSTFLKLRIKHEQNWLALAETEWAKDHVTGNFEPWSFDPDSYKDWTVMNASLDQLKELEDAQAKNPDHELDIMRSRWNNDDGFSIHRTFLRCRIKTPTGYELLYSEITDASEE